MPLVSEAQFLHIVDRYFPKQHPSLILGRGDDCAVLSTQGNICFSSDLFLEDVHFRQSYFSAEDIGYKSLAVNISDVAAMGVRPLGFSLGIGISPSIDEKWLEKFFLTMSTLAKEHNMALVGGDVTRAPFIHICISIWGDCSGASLNVKRENKQNFLTRGGAMPGDTLFVVGQVGLARVGLTVLERYGIKANEQWPESCMAHLRPRPLVNAGLLISRLGQQARPPVLMDISDGLARDLPRLLGMDENFQGPLGAQVILPEALLHREVIKYNREQGLCPSMEAWLGGEDYALLGACVPKLFPLLHAALPGVYSVGTITDDGKISLNGDMLQGNLGFDHFQ